MFILKKKIWANFQRMIEFFAQILSLSSQKYEFGIQGSKMHQIPDLQHCCQHRRTLGEEHLPASVKTHGQKNKYQKHSDRVMSAEIQLQAFKPQQL